MLAQTHLYLAEFALDQVKGRGIYLNEQLFKIGSILPDFSPYHKLIRHYQEESKEYVEKTINEIIGCNNINVISFKAGIASHYLADYFCYPHYNNMGLYTRDALEHIRYEQNLNIEIKNILTDQSMVKEYKFQNLKEILKSHMEEYKNDKIFIEDVSSSLSIIVNTLENMNNWEPEFVI